MSSASSWKTAPRQIGFQLAFFVVSIAVCSLILHTVHVTKDVRTIRKTLQPCPLESVHVPVSPSKSQQRDDVPDIFIYRRTKKTGSSAMLDGLLKILEPYGYHPIYIGGAQANEFVRAESIRRNPRRLFLAQHNQVMKNIDPHRRSIIADTFRDGYEQMTSYCRYSKVIQDCGKEVIQCLKSEYGLAQNRYRWAGTQEDSNSYIDLPLSSAHPALSTTVLRRVFPNATLQLDNYNVANSTCPEIPELRQVYNERYKLLDKQVDTLRKRMLVLAGYPLEKASGGHISFADMVDAADRIESSKYNIRESKKTTKSNAKSHSSVLSQLRVWTRSDDGSVTVMKKFGKS